MAPTQVLTSGRRYGAIAVALHWIIAALILLQIGIGWYMNHVVPDHSPIQDQIETVHISIGLTALLFILARIVWRLVNPPPPLPASMPGWERTLAGASHFLFYVLMLALPLTGWLMVSLRPHAFQFWGFGWPRLPGLEGLTGRAHRPFYHMVQDIHTDYLVWITLANLALHLAGAFKHQFDGRPVLWRMIPFLKKPAG